MFNNGVPSQITPAQFLHRYAQYFPALTLGSRTLELQGYIDDVYTMYYGVNELWRNLAEDVWYNKSVTCYGLLIAWYIVDMVPDLAEEAGIASRGAIPIASKAIGSVKITYEGSGNGSGFSKHRRNADLLSELKSNAFGVKAYSMIKASGRMQKIYSMR